MRNRRHTLIENVKLDPHTYLVTIGTDLGAFSGVVECREEDWDKESQYFGFELAELKAEIEFARAKRKEIKAQLIALRRFWCDMMDTRTYRANDFWVKQMRRRLSELEDSFQAWSCKVDRLRNAYQAKITAFDNAHSIKRGK
jgi:uncharacterized protein YecE (DUF72 family)